MLYNVPRSCHQLLSVAVASAWSLGSRRKRREEEEEEQLGYAASHRQSDLLPSAVICCLNPSLIPRSAF